MMSEHKCNSCFYMQNERSRNPCNVCEGYNKYVNRNIYIHQPAAKGEDYFVPDTITIKEWDNEDAFDGFYGGSEDYVEQGYDTVSRPKHYMLFDKGFYPEGIEVREVISKLVEKIQKEIKKDDYPQPYSCEPLFISDYVQMMQYLMRFMDKNGKEDLEKARWYLDKLIDAYGTDS